MTRRRLKLSEKTIKQEMDKMALHTYYSNAMPHSDDVERCFLATCMSDQRVAESMAYRLKPEWFYDLYNQDVYKAVRFLAKCKQPVSVEAVSRELERRYSMIPAEYLQTVIPAEGRADIAEYHAAIIAQQAIVREIMTIGQRYAVVDQFQDCDEVYVNFKQDCQNLEKSIAIKAAPQQDWHLMTPDDRMSFGKYRGYAVSQVLAMQDGIEYLEWCEDNVTGVYIDWPQVFKYKQEHISVGIGKHDDGEILGTIIPDDGPLPF